MSDMKEYEVSVSHDTGATQSTEFQSPDDDSALNIVFSTLEHESSEGSGCVVTVTEASDEEDE